MTRDGQPPADDAWWTVAADAAGVRLDKFLAGDRRLGSRGRVTTALERGKIFVNGTEAGVVDSTMTLIDEATCLDKLSKVSIPSTIVQ